MGAVIASQIRLGNATGATDAFGHIVSGQFEVDAPEVGAAVRQLRQTTGPSLLHIKVRPGSPKNLGRPTVKPHEVKERFMQFLHDSN